MRIIKKIGVAVKIFADVLVKHAQPIGAPDLQMVVQETIERGLADGVIISGEATGNPPSISDLKHAAEAAGRKPVFIGSGASWDNIPELIHYANGAIVSSSLKRKGKIDQPIDPIRVRQFVDAMAQGVVQKSDD